jgi:hypothetical protein
LYSTNVERTQVHDSFMARHDRLEVRGLEVV